MGLLEAVRTLVRRDIVFKPSWSNDLSTVRTGFGVVGKRRYSVTDGTLVRQSAPLTFDEVTPKLPDSIYGYISTAAIRSSPPVLGEGRRLQRCYWLFDHPVQLPPTSGSGLVFYIQMSVEASTTSRYRPSAVW
jgi:hypothetical protein